jgi:hypothetical protein
MHAKNIISENEKESRVLKKTTIYKLSQNIMLRHKIVSDTNIKIDETNRSNTLKEKFLTNVSLLLVNKINLARINPKANSSSIPINCVETIKREYWEGMS